MTDYIKRDDVIETVYQIRQKPADDEWANKWLTPLQDIPAADVVEVVRCKNCKYWQDQEEGIVEVPICMREDCFIVIMGENDFCSYGERRE